MNVLYNIILPFQAALFFNLALAPNNLWYLSLISSASLFYIFDSNHKTKIFALLNYSVMLYSLGMYWLIYSIGSHGNLSIYLAWLAIITMGLIQGIFLVAINWFINKINSKGNLKAFIFASLFLTKDLLQEDIENIATPWLQIGNAFTDSPLAFLYPVIGSYGLTWLVYYFGALIIISYKSYHKQKNYKSLISIKLSLFLLLFIVLVSLAKHYLIAKKEITNELVTNLKVIGFQTNQNIDLKWQQDYAFKILEENSAKIVEIAKQQQPDLIIMPETTFGFFYNNIKEYLINLTERIKKVSPRTELVLGLAKANSGNQFFNSMININNNDSYYKEKLVPVGEQILFPKLLFPLTNYIGIILASFVSPNDQDKHKTLTIHKYQVTPLICYEVAYARLINRKKNGKFILLIGEDGWFTDVHNPLSSQISQYNQMAKARAMEQQKYLISINNNQMSQLISPDGKVLVQLTKHKQDFLVYNLPIKKKQTKSFFSITISYLLNLNSLFLIVIFFIRRKAKNVV